MPAFWPPLTGRPTPPNFEVARHAFPHVPALWPPSAPPPPPRRRGAPFFLPAPLQPASHPPKISASDRNRAASTRPDRLAPPPAAHRRTAFRPFPRRRRASGAGAAGRAVWARRRRRRRLPPMRTNVSLHRPPREGGRAASPIPPMPRPRQPNQFRYPHSPCCEKGGPEAASRAARDQKNVRPLTATAAPRKRRAAPPHKHTHRVMHCPRSKPMRRLDACPPPRGPRGAHAPAPGGRTPPAAAEAGPAPSLEKPQAVIAPCERSTAAPRLTSQGRADCRAGSGPSHKPIRSCFVSSRQTPARAGFALAPLSLRVFTAPDRVLPPPKLREQVDPTPVLNARASARDGASKPAPRRRPARASLCVRLLRLCVRVCVPSCRLYPPAYYPHCLTSSRTPPVSPRARRSRRGPPTQHHPYALGQQQHCRSSRTHGRRASLRQARRASAVGGKEPSLQSQSRVLAPPQSHCRWS